MSDIVKLATGIVLFSAQLIAAGILLGIGFRFADKLADKFSKRSR